MANKTAVAGHMLTTPQTRGQLHQSLIDEVLRDWPEAETRRFMRSLRTLPDADYTPWICEAMPNWYKYVSFIPDAYLIDQDERHVVVFEAVVNNDVSDDKFAKMVDLSWALDEDRYTLILVRCDRYGRTAYDVQRASLAEMIDNLHVPGHVDSWHVADWPKYTLEYCSARLGEAA